MSFLTDVEEAITVLKNGGTILYPTDTVWGIGCDATNEAAVDKVFRIKKRNQEKSMIILLANEADILHYTNDHNPIIFDYIKNVFKPTTVIYEGARNLATNGIGKDGTVGIRIVKDPFCKALIEVFGKPLLSTSSNISGYPPPALFEDIDAEIKSGVDYIVQHRQEDLTPAEPSTVIKLNHDGSIQILRP